MEKSARDKKRETRIRMRISGGKARDLYSFLRLALAGAVYDMETDRYVMDGGKSSKSLDREFYDTLCEMAEKLSAAVAANRSAAIL